MWYHSYVESNFLKQDASELTYNTETDTKNKLIVTKVK